MTEFRIPQVCPPAERTVHDVATVDVAIVTHRRPELLERTLASLAAAERPAGLAAVHVTEVGGADSSSSLCERFAADLPIRYRSTPDRRKAAALNQTLHQCEGLVIFFDDDVVVSRATMTAYAAAARTAAAAATACFWGGPVSVDRPHQPPEWLLPTLPKSATGYERLGTDGRFAFPTVALGFNWAALAIDLARAGGFPERFGPGTVIPTGDETIAQLRLAACGLVGQFVPDARVTHAVPAERCSSDWMLGRTRAAGTMRAIYTSHFDPTAPATTAAKTRRLIAQQLRSRRRALVRPWTPQGRFHWRRLGHLVRGFVRGCRLAPSCQLLPPAAARDAVPGDRSPAGPVAAGPVAARPVAAGSVAAGPVAAGPVAAGTDVSKGPTR